MCECVGALARIRESQSAENIEIVMKIWWTQTRCIAVVRYGSLTNPAQLSKIIITDFLNNLRGCSQSALARVHRVAAFTRVNGFHLIIDDKHFQIRRGCLYFLSYIYNLDCMDN